MYSLIKSSSFKTILQHELPCFVVALAIAQLYFKWGSFGLELIGFIATWYVLGYLMQLILPTAKKSNSQINH